MTSRSWLPQETLILYGCISGKCTSTQYLFSAVPWARPKQCIVHTTAMMDNRTASSSSLLGAQSWARSVGPPPLQSTLFNSGIARHLTVNQLANIELTLQRPTLPSTLAFRHPSKSKVERVRNFCLPLSPTGVCNFLWDTQHCTYKMPTEGRSTWHNDDFPNGFGSRI